VSAAKHTPGPRPYPVRTQMFLAVVEVQVQNRPVSWIATRAAIAKAEVQS